LKKADSASTITPFLAALSLARIAGVTLGRHNGKVECCDTARCRTMKIESIKVKRATL